MRLTILLALCLTVHEAVAQEDDPCPRNFTASNQDLPDLGYGIWPIPADTVAVGIFGRRYEIDGVILQGTHRGQSIKFIRGQVIVGLRRPGCPQDLAPLIEALGLTVLEPFEPSVGVFSDFTSALLLIPPSRDFSEAITALRASPAVWYVDLNQILDLN